MARGYSHIYIMEMGTEEIIPQDIISDEIKIHAKSNLSDKAEEIKNHLRFKDVSRTKLYHELQSGHLKNVDITYNIRKVVTEVLSNIAAVGAKFLNTMMFKTKDSYLMDHSINTTLISILIGKKYGFNKTELSNLAAGTFLHDFGKIVLQKMKESSIIKDSDEQMDELMKEHSTFGYLIVNNSKNSSPIVGQIINQHHEHQDGSGYPIGLRGQNLPPVSTARRNPRGTIYRLSEICTVADVYDNLVMNPLNEEKMHPSEAMKLLILGSGSLYNKEIVSTLTQIIPSFPEGAMVKIKRMYDRSIPKPMIGYTAVVAKINEKNLNRPIIILLRDEFNKEIPLQVIDTSEMKEVELELIL